MVTGLVGVTMVRVLQHVKVEYKHANVLVQIHLLQTVEILVQEQMSVSGDVKLTKSVEVR